MANTYNSKNYFAHGGGELVIGSQSSEEPGDLTWPDKKVWHKSKEDAALLYDVYGRLIDSMN